MSFNINNIEQDEGSHLSLKNNLPKKKYVQYAKSKDLLLLNEKKRININGFKI